MPGERLPFLALLWALAASACAPGPAPGPPVPAGDGSFFVAGYHPWWAGESWRTYPLEVLDRVYLFELEIAGDGAIADARGWPRRWRELGAAASRAGADIVPTLTLPDPGTFQALFADPDRRTRLVQEAVAAVEAFPGAAGLHLDVEIFSPVDPVARDGYTAFVAELVRVMRRRLPGLPVSGFLLAFDPGEAYNEAALAQLLDYVVVQGYDLHYLDGPRSGPLSPLAGWGGLNLEGVVERLDRQGVPRGRVVLSLPLYGYEWPTVDDEPGAATRGPGVILPLTAPPEVLPGLPRALDRAERYGVRQDGAGGGRRYAWRDETGWYQGWYDDAGTLAAKVAWARGEGLGGVAFFPLSYASDGAWALIRSLDRGRRND